MSQDEAEPTPEHGVRDAVREALRRGDGIRAEVEQITRGALGEGRLDLGRVRRVVEAVAQGVSDGAHTRPDDARRGAAEALEGLQQALGHSAMSARLAIEEAAGRASTDEDVRRVLHTLRDLESTMLGALNETAKAGKSAGARALGELADHLQRTGSRLGDDVQGALDTLSKALPEALRESAGSALAAMRETGARSAQVASGVLGGLADALRGESDRADDEPKGGAGSS